MKNSTYNKFIDILIFTLFLFAVLTATFGFLSLLYYGTVKLLLISILKIHFVIDGWDWFFLLIPSSLFSFLFVTKQTAQTKYGLNSWRCFWAAFGTQLYLPVSDGDKNRISEINEWLDENTNSLFQQCSSISKHQVRFIFLKKSDAMACKLRWDYENDNNS